MLKSCLCDYREVYIPVKRTITAAITGTVVDPNNRGKKVIFKSSASFPDCIGKINNTHVHHAKDTDVVMPMYSLIEYSDFYSKTSGSLWHYYRDEPVLSNTGGTIIYFRANNNNNNRVLSKFYLKEKNRPNRQ